MNIARWFSAYRIIEADLQAERDAHADTRRKAEEERQKLIDAVARAAGKPAIFAPPPPPVQAQTMAFGPTMIKAAHAQREEATRIAIDTPPTDDEIERVAEAARKKSAGNGNGSKP